MKLINYLFTNRLSIRWWMRRCALILFGLSVIWLIAWSLFVNQWLTTDRVTSLLSKPEVVTQIDRISTFLSGDQYITVSEASWFVTNKTGVWFEDTRSVLEVKLDSNCEDWFTSNGAKQWALITNKSLCFNGNNKQQVVTWAQIMSGVNNGSGIQDPETVSFLARYPSLSQVLSGDVITITTDTLQWLETTIKAMTQDTQIISVIVEGISTVATIMLVPLWFIAVFFAIVMTIMLFIWLIIYSLITRAIAGIMKYDIDFEQAFALSWLPWIVVKIAGTMVWFDWYLRILIWIIIVIGLIYYYKNNKTSNQ